MIGEDGSNNTKEDNPPPPAATAATATQIQDYCLLRFNWFCFHIWNSHDHFWNWSLCSMLETAESHHY
jgi:hypothetical protein